jgi:PAS domain S-box-containing protein
MNARFGATLLGFLSVLAVLGRADDPARAVVFGTVQRLTPRGAPVRQLDDAAFDQDLAELVAKAAGLPFRIVEFKNAPEVLAALENGAIDVIPSYARLPERVGKYLFTVRHTVSTAAVFMRKGDRPPTSLAEVAALRLAAARDSSASSYARRKNLLARTALVADTADALRAVASGRVAACLSNQLVGLSVAREIGLAREVVPVFTLPDSAVDFCMAVRLGDGELLTRLNDGLLLASERGDLQRHREKWLPVFESYWLSEAKVRRWLVLGGTGIALVALLTWRWYRYRLRTEHRLTEQVSRLVEERTRALKAANDQLRASEEIFAKAFRASPDAIGIVRQADGRFIDVNEAVMRMFGHPREAVLGRSAADLGLWVDPAQREAMIAAMRAEGRAREWPMRFRRADGTTGDALISVERVQIGGEACFVSIVRDTTEQQAAKEALEASERKYRLLFENLTVGFALHEVICDERGQPIDYRYLEVNPAFEKLTGVAASTLLGKTVKQVMPNTEAYWIEAFGRVATTGEPMAYENYSVELKRHYDTWTFSPRRGQFAVVFTDITTRKQAEETVLQLNRDLEKRVEERTAELARRVAEVEQLNQELESFSYSVSHDLRTPLRNITGFLELLTNRSAGRLDAEEVRYVETVSREATRLNTLIQALLEFSRVGRTALNFSPVPLDELVAEVRAELAELAAGREIEWRVGPLPVLSVDRTLLRLVFANLLANAVKFTRARQPAVIEVGALPSDTGDGRTTFFVRDNGAGFNPSYAGKLFGVFQRLHNQRDFEGTGIGLANVKRIVERHGGRVWAEGKVDNGAVFYFNLNSSPP